MTAIEIQQMIKCPVVDEFSDCNLIPIRDCETCEHMRRQYATHIDCRYPESCTAGGAGSCPVCKDGGDVSPAFLNNYGWGFHCDACGWERYATDKEARRILGLEKEHPGEEEGGGEQ